MIPIPDYSGSAEYQRVKKRPGAPRNFERYKQFARAVEPYDKLWSEGSNGWLSYLGQICLDLDRAGLATPTSWTRARSRRVRLAGICPDSWSAALDLGLQQLVADYIRWNVNQVREKRHRESWRPEPTRLPKPKITQSPNPPEVKCHRCGLSGQHASSADCMTHIRRHYHPAAKPAGV